ncbi:FecR family protein [Pedobacter cryoconitis]|uniref:Ferric-dicitrate binding protein FerR (Iron transport regulator) n=1 Tax=Pedobacter cryoconitis TaxID=188932 RepID=A0A7X0J0D6_9SPHI|nr:FecR family protein [Pedobacter cryoconitis]MBB6498384.1 ferric-dicitrate binding protein FerR (iron transport regulator) [Pedobacter cryoconitis]
MPELSRLEYLLQQYAESNCTHDELLELMELINKMGDDQELSKALSEVWKQINPADPIPKIDQEQIFRNVLDSGKIHRLPVRKYQTVKWIAAAILLFCLGLGLHNINKQRVSVQDNLSAEKVIKPGTNRAVLTLANGKTLKLDDNNAGNTLKQGNTTIIRLGKGQLAYLGDTKNNNGDLAYNTLTTPKGGQYQIELPDGTRVWLNASSSLRFPVQFQGENRRVILEGEAYFEVAKNKYKPFHVEVNHTDIQVLGTHFNVMGYADEVSTNTTLLEGSVLITAGTETGLLKPGEQAKVKDGIHISKADPLEALAWKNGNFNFGHEKIQSIMRKLSRWYNVDVKYEGNITKEGFVGTVKRSKKLSDVLDVLESTGLAHFKVEERSVTVMP